LIIKKGLIDWLPWERDTGQQIQVVAKDGDDSRYGFDPWFYSILTQFTLTLNLAFLWDDFLIHVPHNIQNTTIKINGFNLRQSIFNIRNNNKLGNNTIKKLIIIQITKNQIKQMLLLLFWCQCYLINHTRFRFIMMSMLSQVFSHAHRRERDTKWILMFFSLLLNLVWLFAIEEEIGFWFFHIWWLFYFNSCWERERKLKEKQRKEEAAEETGGREMQKGTIGKWEIYRETSNSIQACILWLICCILKRNY